MCVALPCSAQRWTSDSIVVMVSYPVHLLVCSFPPLPVAGMYIHLRAASFYFILFSFHSKAWTTPSWIRVTPVVSLSPPSKLRVLVVQLPNINTIPSTKYCIGLCCATIKYHTIVLRNPLSSRMIDACTRRTPAARLMNSRTRVLLESV